MTQIANVRSFNGTSDYIQLTPDDYNAAVGNTTWAAIVKHNSDANTYRSVVSTSGGTGGEWEFGVNVAQLFLWEEPGTVNGGEVTVSQDIWYLIAATKTTGTTAVRWHAYNYGTPGWSHVDDGATIADTATLSGASLWLGSYTTANDFWNGKIACVGVWRTTALSDANLETMTGNIAAWETLTPTGLWLLDQPVASGVVDRIGAGDQIAISGTTMAAESTLAFDVGGVVVSPGDNPPIGFLGRGAGW